MNDASTVVVGLAVVGVVAAVTVTNVTCSIH